MTEYQLVRQWITEQLPGHFDGQSAQDCYIAAHKASGLTMAINLFRDALWSAGYKPVCIRTGNTDRPNLYRLGLPDAKSAGVTPRSYRP